MSNRIEKIDSLLQRNLSDIINNKLNDPRINGIISVANVETTKDLKYSKVFLSIYNDNKEETLDAINSASGYIRKILAKEIEFRCVPSLNFVVDNSAEYSEKINNILRDIKK